MEVSAEILFRAKNLFTKCGIKSITMDDLAKGMGISKKTLYEQVDSKASLIEQMISHHIKDEKKALAKIKSQSSNAVEEMILITQYVIQLLQQVSPNVIFEIKKYYWETWKKLEKLNNEHILQVIQHNLKQGIEQGYYRSDLSFEIISRHYVTLAGTVMDLDIFPAHQYTRDRIFKETILYHLRGITTPEGWEICLKHFSNLDNNKI